MPEIDPVEYGKMLAKVTALESEVSELRKDMKTVLLTLQEARGGWRLMMLLGGASAAAGGFIVKLAPLFQVGR